MVTDEVYDNLKQFLGDFKRLLQIHLFKEKTVAELDVFIDSYYRLCRQKEMDVTMADVFDLVVYSEILSVIEHKDKPYFLSRVESFYLGNIQPTRAELY